MLFEFKFTTNYKMIFVLFYGLERTIFIRKCDATNYFRLVAPSVDQLELNELMTQRLVASLTDAA